MAVGAAAAVLLAADTVLFVIRRFTLTWPRAPFAPRHPAMYEHRNLLLAARFALVALVPGMLVLAGLPKGAAGSLGLGILLATGVLTLGDIAKEGDVLATFIWFAVLYTLSGQLNELGFMGYVGQRLAGALGGLSWPAVYVILAVAYVLLHYLFVSQTAQILALFGVFLDVGVKLGVPAAPLGFLLLFASNFFAVITPQGSSANLLFAGSGYLSQGELYRLGAITTAVSLVYLLIGTPG
jgi:DASS family divalent anion:Na+ symporter